MRKATNVCELCVSAVKDPDAMITKEKKAMLHVAKTQLGLTDEQYRAILVRHTGCLSSADARFGDKDFNDVLNHFKILGFEVKRSFERQPARAEDLSSPRHLKMLEHCWDDFAEFEPQAHSRKFREGFNRRLIKKPWPQTRREVNFLIEATKARLKRIYNADGNRQQAAGNSPGRHGDEEAGRHGDRA